MTGPRGLRLDDYRERIGHSGPVAADADTLAAIVAGHSRSIAFENLDPFCRVPVGLDLASLEDKLVRGSRGGWCFEQNLLLKHALDAIGFRTTGLAARVLWGRPPDSPLPLPARSHMVVRVDLDDGPRIVDVGFGGLTLTGVLRLEPDVEQPTPHELFRLVAAGDAFDLQALVRGEWGTLYRFGLEPQVQADYEVSSWYLANHPDSHFLRGISVARADEGRRYALRNDSLAIHHVGGDTEQRTLADLDELKAVLRDDLLLRVPDSPEFDRALGRLFSP